MKENKMLSFREKELRSRYWIRIVGGVVISILMTLIMLIKEIIEFVKLMDLCE